MTVSIRGQDDLPGDGKIAFPATAEAVEPLVPPDEDRKAEAGRLTKPPPGGSCRLAL
jgi:hypothetical protein